MSTSLGLTSKKTALVVLFVAAALALYYFARPTPPPIQPAEPEIPGIDPTVSKPSTAEPMAPAAPSPSKPTSPPEVATPRPPVTGNQRLPAPAKVTFLPVAETANLLHAENEDPQEDLHILEGLLEGYRRVYKWNPVAGLNEEVVEALIGYNDKNVALIAADHPAINDQGQLVDRWGTPYVFHALSGEHMQIASAGPDKKLGTPDDFVIE